MFKCQFSGQVSEPGERPVHLVTHTRKREYVHAPRKVTLENGEVVEEPFITYGIETVKEILVLNRHLEKAKEKFGLA